MEKARRKLTKQLSSLQVINRYCIFLGQIVPWLVLEWRSHKIGMPTCHPSNQVEGVAEYTTDVWQEHISQHALCWSSISSIVSGDIFGGGILVWLTVQVMPSSPAFISTIFVLILLIMTQNFHHHQLLWNHMWSSPWGSCWPSVMKS